MKKRQMIRLAYSLILFLGVTSCYSPKEVVRLNPESQKTKWFYGKEFVKDSLDGIIVSIAFDKLIRPDLVFDVEVTNQSNIPYLVEPAQIYSLLLDQNLSPLPNSIKTYAIDPEFKLLEYDKRISLNEARQKNGAIIGAAAAGVAIATAIASTTTDDEDKQNRRAATSFTSAIISNAASTTSDVAKLQTYNLADEREEWEKSVLQKTTLDPGCSIRGKVFIKYNSKAYFYKLFIPVDNQELQLLFKQRKYDPRN